MAISPELRAALDLKASKALSAVDRSMTILEVGPSYAPIAPRSAGWKSFSLDHASQEELRVKYSGIEGIDIGMIEPVDFVWTGGPPSSAIPDEHHGSFDAVIASHVLEHIPNPIAWLYDLGMLLRPGGVLSIILPDKRYVLDCLRHPTSAGAWIDAFDREVSRHSKGTLYDCHAYTTTNDGLSFWGPQRFGKIKFLTRFVDVPQVMNRAHGNDYVDAHAWCFTPSSFELIMLEMKILGLLPFEAVLTFPTYGCEFYTTFRKTPPIALDEIELLRRRMELMHAIQYELRTQTDYMFAPIWKRARWFLDDAKARIARAGR